MIYTNFLPGYEFKVRDDFPIKNYGALLPNSKGFVAYSNNMFGFNTGNISSKNKLVLTRKGKKGKDRLEIISLTSPIIYDDAFAKEEPEIFKKVYKQNTVLKTNIIVTNILEMSNLSFIAWCTAYRLFIINSFNASNYNLKRLPKKESHAFNKIKNIGHIFNIDRTAAILQVSEKIQRRIIVQGLREVERLLFNHFIKNLLAISFMDERPVLNLLNYYKHVSASKKAIKEVEILKNIIVKDGLKAIEKHIDF